MEHKWSLHIRGPLQHMHRALHKICVCNMDRRMLRTGIPAMESCRYHVELAQGMQCAEQSKVPQACGGSHCGNLCHRTTPRATRFNICPILTLFGPIFPCYLQSLPLGMILPAQRYRILEDHFTKPCSSGIVLRLSRDFEHWIFG